MLKGRNSVRRKHVEASSSASVNRITNLESKTWESIESAHTTLSKWRKKMAQWGDSSKKLVDQEFLNAMEKDLDAPRALQRIRTVEKIDEISDANKRAIFMYADEVLGLDLSRQEISKNISAEQEKLLSARLAARKEKRWSDSDALRAELESTGLEISDSADGQAWSWR